MKKLISKYLVGSTILQDKEYLPQYEYEFIATPKGNYAQKHKRITNEYDWQKYWGNIGARYTNKEMNRVGTSILPYTLGLGNPLLFISGIVGGEVFDDGTRATSNGKYLNWGSMVSDKTGINSDVALLLNPGYYLASGLYGIKNLKAPIHLQPLMFNENAMYRIIGETGYKDAVSTKGLRPNMNPADPHYRGVNKRWNWFTKGHPNDKFHPVTFSNGRHPIDAVYPGDVIVEVSPEHPLFSSFLEHLPDAGIYKTADVISTESPYIKFYKRNKKGKYFNIDNPTYTQQQ